MGRFQIHLLLVCLHLVNGWNAMEFFLLRFRRICTQDLEYLANGWLLESDFVSAEKSSHEVSTGDRILMMLGKEETKRAGKFMILRTVDFKSQSRVLESTALNGWGDGVSGA